MIETIKEILKNNLAVRLKLHHSIYTPPCTAEYLEEAVSRTLAENGYSNDWQPNRKHTISVDMNLDIGGSISVKSGIFDPAQNTLTFSGSRLGKHKTLPEMVKSVIDNEADYYVCVSKTDQDWSNTPALFDMRTYYLFVFPSSVLKYGSEWITGQTPMGNTIYSMDIPGMNASIKPSLSYQLWTTISTDLIGMPDELDIIL